jgi:sulfotransferase 6B1
VKNIKVMNISSNAKLQGLSFNSKAIDFFLKLTLLTLFLYNAQQLHAKDLFSKSKQKEFVLYTMPKTGTHLITPFLELLTDKTHVGESLYKDLYPVRDAEKLIELLSAPDQIQVHWWLSPVPKARFANSLDQIRSNKEYLILHAPYSNEMEDLLSERNCTVFHILRDPRDYAVSLLHHLRKQQNLLFLDRKFEAADIDTQLLYIIVGTDWYNSTHTVVNKFLGWLSSPISCVLQFEKLMGPLGGVYSTNEQLIELRKIPAALNMQVSDAKLLQLFSQVYGHGKTFHKGIVGSWKEHFNPEHKRIFKELLGDVLISLGYEKDYNW